MNYKQIFLILSINCALFATKTTANDNGVIQIALVPKQQITISSEVASFVTSYKGIIGEKITKDSPLVLLNEKRYQGILNSKNAEVYSAKVKLEYSKNRLKENELLFNRGAIGKTVIADSRLSVLLDKGTLDAAESMQLLAQYNLKSCSINAPFSGRLVKKNVREKEYVNAGEPICEFLQDNKLLAIIHIPSSQIMSVNLEDKFKIEIVENHSVVHAVIVEISPNIDPGSHTFEVKAEIDNSEYKLRAGMMGKIKRRDIIKK